MMRQSVIVLIGVFLLAAAGVSAQDSTAEPTAAIESTPLLTTTPTVDANALLAEAQRTLDEARQATQTAFSLVSLFEVAGVILTSVAVIGYFNAVERLRSDRNKIMSQAKATREKLESDFQARQAALNKQVEARLQDLQSHYKQKVQSTATALALLPLGLDQYLVQDYEGARKTYERALHLDPDNAIVHYYLGYVYLLQERLDDAKEEFEKALDTKKDSGAAENKLVFSSAIAALGYVYRRQAETLPNNSDEQDDLFLKAETHIKAALREYPNLVDLDRQSWWGALGSLHRRRGRNDEALDAYNKAKDATPFSSYPYSNIARLELKQNNVQAALEMYETVKELAANRMLVEPENYWWYTDLIMAQLALGEDDEAQKTLDKMLRLKTRGSNYPVKSLIAALKVIAEFLPDTYKSRRDKIDEVIRALEKPTP